LLSTDELDFSKPLSNVSCLVLLPNNPKNPILFTFD